MENKLWKYGAAASLEEAKAEFQKCFEAWNAWAKMEEMPAADCWTELASEIWTGR